MRCGSQESDFKTHTAGFFCGLSILGTFSHNLSRHSLTGDALSAVF